jgi:TonB family protein
MSFSWKQYEGQVINNTFPLQRYLGGSSESAGFITQLAGPQSSKAVIKLIPEDVPADLQLSLWRRASKLTHPNLLQLYQGGRCRLADIDLLYVVMEYAEEDLSQILPQRALTPSEARDMLGPVLDALSDLHAQGLVHSRLKPSNVLATSDQVKLSTDRLFPSGEVRKSSAKRTAYDAPESANQPLTAASDVWSLGVMLIEVLTQRAADRQLGGQSLPVAPESLPQPFRDIARHALDRDPKLRWTIADIAVSLNPRAAAAAVQSASPLSVPLSPIPAVPAAKLQVPKPALPVAPMAKAPRPAPPAPPALVPPLIVQPPIIPPLAQAPKPRPSNLSAPKPAIVLPSYVVPLAVAVVVVGAIIALPKFLGKRAESSSSASTSATARAAAPESAEQPARPEASRSVKSNSSSTKRDSSKTSAAKPAAKETSQPPAVSPSPASLRTETKLPADAPAKSATDSGPSSNASSNKGEVLDQVLPDVSDKSLATIHGTVRVSVRAHVDPAGNVSAAELDNPGPSQYFADLALKAIRRWEFTSPEVGGRSVPSEWQVRFEFSPSGVKAFPQQTAP